MAYTTTKAQLEMMERAFGLMTAEEKERSQRLGEMTDGESMVMGSAIEIMIRKQGLAKTKVDINAIIDSVNRMIKAFTPTNIQ